MLVIFLPACRYLPSYQYELTQTATAEITDTPGSPTATPLPPLFTATPVEVGIIEPIEEQAKLADFADPEVNRKRAAEIARIRERRHQRERISWRQERLIEWHKRNVEDVIRIREARDKKKREQAEALQKASKPTQNQDQPSPTTP